MLTQWPRDSVFLGDAQAGLVWLADRGYGYLHVADQPYDAAYFQKYETYAETDMGESINAARAELIERHVSRDKFIIDIGIGCGAFLSELVTRGYSHVGGFDINPAGIDWLRARALYADPMSERPYALTFWDSFEHIPEVWRLLEGVQFVAMSLPIVDGDGPPRRNWKHFRPDEHCWYFTRAGLIHFMTQRGFECIEHGTPESLLGREDIHTFAFRRAK
jgi:hypothetical protein